MCSTCQKSINGRKSGRGKKNRTMKKRRYSRVRGLNSKDLGSLATQAAIGAAGAIGIRMILGKVLPADYQQYSNYALLAAGLVAAGGTKNPWIANAGVGATMVAATAVLQDLVDGQGAMGLLPPGKNFDPKAYPNSNYNTAARPL